MKITGNPVILNAVKDLSLAPSVLGMRERSFAHAQDDDTGGEIK